MSQHSVFVGLALVAALANSGYAQAGSRQQREQVVTLTAVIDRTPPSWFGMNNIFFELASAAVVDSIRPDSAWRDVEVADVVRREGLRTVRAVRYRFVNDTTRHYVVDTTGHLDLRSALALTFHPFHETLVADFTLVIGSTTGSTRAVAYQILASTDRKYTYARVA